jgi:hypothetical protein
MLQKDARSGCGPPQSTRNVVFGSTQNAVHVSAGRHCDAGTGAEKRPRPGEDGTGAARRRTPTPRRACDNDDDLMKDVRDGVIHRTLC